MLRDVLVSTWIRCAEAAVFVAAVRSRQASVPSALTEPGELEIDYHGNRPLVLGNRLGCVAKICGDMVIDIPAMSQVHRQIVRKDLDLGALEVDPTFALYYVAVEPQQLGDGATASTELRNAIAEQHHIAKPTIATHAA